MTHSKHFEEGTYLLPTLLDEVSDQISERMHLVWSDDTARPVAGIFVGAVAPAARRERPRCIGSNRATRSKSRCGGRSEVRRCIRRSHVGRCQVTRRRSRASGRRCCPASHPRTYI